MIFLRRIANITGILALLLLTACGGSGGGGTGSGNTNNLPDYIALPKTPFQVNAVNTYARVSDNKTSGYYSQAASDKMGNTLIVWMLSNGSSYHLMYSYYDAVTKITSGEQILYTMDRPYPFSIASNGASFMLAYSFSGAANSRIFDGSSWSVESSVQTVAGYTTGLKVASYGAGYVAAWSQASKIYMNIYSSAAWASSQLQVSDPANTNPAYEPVISSNGTGYAIAWKQSDGTADSVYANMFENSAWSGATLLETGTTAVSNVGITSDSSGYSVVWQQNNSIYSNIYTATPIPVLSGETLVESGATTSATNPVIASNGSSYGLVWSQAGKVYFSLYSGSTWGTKQEIGGLTDITNFPYIAASGSSYGVIWRERDTLNTSVYNVYARSTADGSTWDSVQYLESGTGQTQLTSILSGVGGNFIALWSQDNDTGEKNELYYSMYDGNSWGVQAAVMQSVYPGSVLNTRVASNNSGEVFVVWTQFSNGKVALFAALGNDEGWHTPVLVDDQVLYGHAPAITTNGNDFALSWWSFATRKIQVGIYSNGVMNAPVSVSSGAGSPSKLGIVSNGTSYAVVWLLNNSGYSLQATYFNGTDWAPETRIDTGTGLPGAPSIASNGTDYIIGWTQSDGVASSVYVNRFNGANWSGPELLETSDNSASGNVQLSALGSNYMAVWSQNDGTPGTANRIYANLYDGLAWSGASLVGGTNGSATNPVIASDGQGYMAAWSEYSLSSLISANQFLSGTWQSEQPIDSGYGQSDSVDIASNGAGYAVVWFKNESSISNIYTNLFDGTKWSGQSLLESVDELAIDPHITPRGSAYVTAWRQADSTAGGAFNVWAVQH